MITRKKILNYVELAYRAKLVKRYRKMATKEVRRLNAAALTSDQKKEIQDTYKRAGLQAPPNQWHQLYSHVFGSFHADFVPEDLFYSTIEPKMNRREMFPTLVDKNLLSKLFPNTPQPVTLFKNINGMFLDEKDKAYDKKEVIGHLSKRDVFFIKPSIDSGGGKKVRRIDLSNHSAEERKQEIEQLLATYKRDFLTQIPLSQSKELSRLNPTSLNTVRLMTHLSDGQVRVLSSYVRFGGEGSFVDNTNSGGLCCGIQSDGGLKTYAYDKKFNKFALSTKGEKFEQISIPNFAEVEETVKRLHLRVPYFKLLSWDIAIDEKDSPVLIEFNVFFQEINSHQIVNGPVLSSLL